MPSLVARLALPSDTSAIDSLRRTSYSHAPWFPGIDLAALRRDRDHPATRVLVIERNGRMLSTVAATLLRTAASVTTLLENPVPSDLQDELPAVVLTRAASLVEQRGLGLMPILRRYYIEAAVRCEARVLLAAHAAQTPNLSGFLRLGFQLTPIGLMPPEQGGVLSADTEVLVSSLPQHRFLAALELLTLHYPLALANVRWVGAPLQLD